jgi:DNA-binding NarL/FixJ family response regulator
VLLAEGRTNPQIGQALFISAKTAGTHVSNILAKLGWPAGSRRPRSPTAATSSTSPDRSVSTAASDVR